MAAPKAHVMYGSKARDLLMELKNAETLPAYNEEGVRQVLAEINGLSREIHDISEPFERRDGDQAAAAMPVGTLVQLCVYDESVRRNKRALLAYHLKRSDLIDGVRWQHGSVLPRDIKEKMSSEEVDYFSSYAKLLTGYLDRLGLDLTADIQPPRDEYIHVLALKACGSLMTMAGTVEVGERTMHSMRRYVAEPLIRIGWMKEIDQSM